MLMMKAAATQVLNEYSIARAGNKVFRLQMNNNGTRTIIAEMSTQSASLAIRFMINIIPYWH
jgi:hypothetical protein